MMVEVAGSIRFASLHRLTPAHDSTCCVSARYVPHVGQPSTAVMSSEGFHIRSVLLALRGSSKLDIHRYQVLMARNFDGHLMSCSRY